MIDSRAVFTPGSLVSLNGIEIPPTVLNVAVRSSLMRGAYMSNYYVIALHV